MMKCEFAENLLALGSKRKQNFAPIFLATCAMRKSASFQAIHQLYSAVVADLHAAGQLADGWAYPGRHALDRQHELILAALQPSLLHHLFAEVKKAADLVAELRQRLIVRQSELLHFRDCIVPRSSNESTSLYRRTIQSAGQLA